MKKLGKLFFIVLLGIFLFNNVLAEKVKVNLDLFYSPTCTHCKDEREFVKQLKEKYSRLNVNEYNLAEQTNIDLLVGKYTEYNVSQDKWGLVPVTFIDGKCFVGFDESISQEIKQIVEQKNVQISEEEERNFKVKIPLIGEIDFEKTPPLLSAIVLGAIDGFNPCAMTALLFLLASLISSSTRKRIFLIGSIFIFVSGLVYFIFISTWLNIILALSYARYITIIVGLIVIAFGFLTLKEYFDGIICKFCETIEEKEDRFSRWQKKLLLKMETFTRAETPLLVAVVGVALVAAGVNLIELICSLGFPLAFTGMLSGLNLSMFSYYSYLLVYIFFYMLDDLIIFIIAVWTLKLIQSSNKYLKAVKLISGILLLILGLIILFKPSLLAL